MSIVLFWVVLSATLPRAAHAAFNHLNVAATLQVLAHALVGFLLWPLARQARGIDAGAAGAQRRGQRPLGACPSRCPHRPPMPPREAYPSAPPPAPGPAPASKPAPSRSLFISYRRVDSSDVTGRIYDRLGGHHGRDRSSRTSIRFRSARDFRRHVAALIEQSDCVLAVIGPAMARRRRRLRPAPPRTIRPTWCGSRSRPRWRAAVPVIPLLVQGAPMPDPQLLPESLRPLAFRNGMSVRADPDFHRDLDRLDEQLRLLAGAGPR
jgi:hypothetical protein